MRVAAVPSIEDERKEEATPLFACARMEVGRAASPHWPELGHLQGSTCQACQGRSSGNMPVSADMRSGPVKRGGIAGPCCEPREGSSWTTPSTRKGVAGSRFSKDQREAGQARQANQAAATRNSRGFDAETRFKAGWLWGIKKQALPLPAHTRSLRFVSFR